MRSFSAPGKALLAGGYLVLKPEYGSYVVALSSRMHAVVKQDELIGPSSSSSITVKVRSTQFNDDEWQYKMDSSSNYSPQELQENKNPFIEKVLSTVFNYFQPDLKLQGNIVIDIYSDAGYHSQAGTKLRSNGVKSFLFHSKSITEVPKTGLGSSAGLVTVLVTALVSCFKQNLDVSSKDDMRLIHNLSQVAHCQAQGKIGSGFDVAAAVYGTITYNRFDPVLIEQLPSPLSSAYHFALVSLIDETDWKIKASRVSLPPRLRLIMGDVNNGSETTKLVAKVNEWYNGNGQAAFKIYKAIDQANTEFVESLRELTALCDQSTSEYEALIETINDKGRKTHPLLQKIVHSVHTIREHFRLITEQSGADIEPEVQTHLLNAAISLPGVLTGVVPGAGGYDAICLITTDSCNIANETKNDPTFRNVTWLDLNQQDLGIIEEKPSTYQNLN
ncbi:phosphomevalonate kinase [Kluyveromyces lactis]|uniref:Phosphomevalonate kinase n=1 Tax=Kluyveromyces lactis (strain ATCC 8585 / CBS 2359 / DSM 70799 / NBRC 1267 / NRRL Y-1140 / WM37) TaxID=284590 RepID=Q6CU75_KLULA|nr:uncharacterized protein KLLA0_C07084g [Kluyveromyces lactis]CAH01365.1 KLLA0C07084p [Kluyveromyces lactis]|eukprot:XP_452514.1 uncharacterized protein KLLA0_C07084g [Kluyveromyces lactis]